MNPLTIDALTHRAKVLKSRISPEDHTGSMLCALIEDICLALRQINAEMGEPTGAKGAALRFLDRKRR